MSIWSLRGATSGAIRNISDAENIKTAGAAADKKREKCPKIYLQQLLLHFYNKSCNIGGIALQ